MLRHLLITGMFCLCLGVTTTQPESTPVESITAAAGAPASISNETTTPEVTRVQLRKLHLVRPDLIPYPLFFEVNC